MKNRIKQSKSKKNLAKKGRDNDIDRTHVDISKIIFDKIDAKILQELIKNPYVKSSKISANLGVPLSTIQRRRRRLEDSTMIEKRFQVDTRQIGLRTADLLLKVSKGAIDSVADDIVNEHSKSVLEISSRVGQLDANMAVRVVYKDSDELLRIINKISTIGYVESIQWTEIVNILLKNENILIENMLKPSDY